jgi:hypothetical protein
LSDHIIREPEFAKRLAQAVAAHPLAPPKHHGQLTWVKRQFAERFNESISPESIRKWFSGEGKPRPDKVAKLASILEVDVAWLSLGAASAVEPKERRLRNAMAAGAVNVVAGLIQMDGGAPAFPTEPQDPVHLYAVIRGAKYDIHVSVGETEGEKVCFTVPLNHHEMLVLGLLKIGFNLEIFEVDAELVETAGMRRKGDIEVMLTREQIRERRIESFAQRI